MATIKFSESISTLAVLLGLVFVGFEIRQNTNAVKGATIQALAEMSQENSMMGIESAELREAFRLVREFGPDSLTVDQLDILGWFTTSSLRVMENRWRQYQLGTLDDLDIIGANDPFWRTIWFRGWWERMGAQMYGEGNDFFRFVDEVIMARDSLGLSEFGLESDLPAVGKR